MMSDVTGRQMDKTLFDAALDIADPAARHDYLAGACAGDTKRQARIERWIERTGVADEFFRSAELERLDSGGDVAEALAEVSAALTHNSTARGEGPGSTIGRYHLLERIGEGGCGVVYLAEQLEPVRRRVALKVIRLGLDTERVIARFEIERQALALMDHPNIAKVLDAGATESGRPYFVMELVPGVKITEHCDAQRLGLRQRLELFLQVCHAIQHAHQKGVIHRDIKPSNILVSSQDGLTVPKVIDFGIVRAVDGRLSERTAITQGDPVLGTPAYMSPEQAEGGQDLDTRCDVYSLGVLLAELLAGRTPIDGERLHKAGMLEMMRILREEEAPAPSAIVAAMEPEERTAAAERRGTDPGKLAAAIRGELDWIVLKALSKDRRLRYETVNGLSMDVRRYLEDEPVLARAPGRFYLLGKMVRRHKVVFVSSSLVLLALVGGLGASNWLLARERAARQDAETARANEARMLRQSSAREAVSLAAILLAGGKIEEADVMLAKNPLATIEPSMEAANLFRALGEWHALGQRWPQAAESCRQYLDAVRFDPSSGMGGVYEELNIGPVLAEAGDWATYRKFRGKVSAFRVKPIDAVHAAVILKTRLLEPGEATDARLIDSLRPSADLLVEVLSKPGDPRASNIYQQAFMAMSLGLMKYRSGEFQEALDWSKACLAYPDANQARAVTAHAVSAMAAQRLGQHELARTELLKARAISAGPFAPNAKFPRGDGQGVWFDWSISRVLLREAEAEVEVGQ